MGKIYRCFEATRNAAGGIDGLGTGWEHIEASSAREAAEEVADKRRNWPECEGLTIVATDDDGEWATVDV